MFPVWTAVKVKTADHPRADQAGTVSSINPATHPDSVVVKFDTDGQDAAGNVLPGSEESVTLSDLVRL